MKGLRCKTAVQQSSGVQELIHLNTTRRHSALSDLFQGVCMRVNGLYLERRYREGFAPECLTVLVQLGALDGRVRGKVFKGLPEGEERIHHGKEEKTNLRR